MTHYANADQIRLALNKICASEEFSGSARLQALLTYVVEETLAGREGNIRAKTIGLDVHKYSPDEIAEREGVVRVDAGRVRRKLEEYYTRGGVFDPVRVALPVGTYVPTFEAVTPVSEKPRTSLTTQHLAIGVFALLAVAVALAAMIYSPGNKSPHQITDILDTDRREIYDISPIRVEAANLASIGRKLIFPAVDQKRLVLALDVFMATIEKDNTYYGGYAGAAQVQATFALIASDPAFAARALEKAEAFSKQALRLGPETAWALSAASWVEFAGNDREAAIELSHRAYGIAPNDPHVAEFDALISLYQSDYERIFEHARKRDKVGLVARNFVFQNALGSAHFHTGNYRVAIDTFEEAVGSGAPFGPIAIGYLAAAHQAIGQQREAAAFAKLLEQTWPDADPASIQGRLFSSSAPGEQLAKALQDARDSVR